MAVVMEAHFKTDDLPAAKKAFNANRDLLEEITRDAQSLGALHHKFVEGDGEVVVIDEWVSEQAFMKFFENNQKIARVTQAAGMQVPPTSLNFYQITDAPGQY